MDPDRWRRIAHLYELALEREPVERGAFLAAVCAGDDELRREVESLIAHEDVPVLIDRPMLDAAAAVLADPRAISTRRTARTSASALAGSDDETAAVTVVREPLFSPLHPIQALLRRRLLILSLVYASLTGLMTIAIFSVRVLPALRQGTGTRPAAWAGLAIYTALVVTATVCACVLWSARSLSLRTLRRMEVVGFSLIALSEVWRIVVSWRVGEVFRHVTADDLGVTLIASRQSLLWFALIVAYGIFIPNTWRRCATVVGVLAATPIVTAAISNSLFGGISPRLMTAYLFNLAIWMVFASALAIYGSHRIDVLRQQALEARRLGQYQLKRLLGAGGMGEVYLAEHLLLRRPCAIKLIRMDRAGDAGSLLRFEREVQATATLTHPNTVQVYDYGHTDDGTFYYVMEYLPGLTLDELVQRHGPTPASRTIHLLRQICGALREAHARGLIHRDIKPGNIIVGERGGLPDVAKLLDFGIVQRLDLVGEGTQVFRGEVMGTPIFMAPEQASGSEPISAVSDIYSLGAVAYFLLTGMPPFLRATATETLAAHMLDAVVPPDRIQPDVPADLQAIVLRCLSKDPDHRYQSADALNDALAGCVHSRP
jgi:eukaryotic-like serine/threonine-protein kinase